MPQVATNAGITFAVDDVAPATEPLDQVRAHEAVRATVGGDIESCSDYHGTVVEDIRYQPLLAAVYDSFSYHYPLVLSPDAVWITIAQGVAHHMVIHGERLRDRFVEHQGKSALKFESRDWVERSPENPWTEAFAVWTDGIRRHVGDDLYDTLVCDFSTTGPLERAASQVVMMDVFERYFHYEAYAACGIPTVTLEGSTEDWQRLASKAAALRVFDLDWWLEHLLPICDQFVRASRGDVDLDHWQAICKLRHEYGGSIVNGWIAKLFPYLRSFIKGPCLLQNEIFETGEGFTTALAPSGLSQVPFTWHNLATGKQRSMEAIGGLVGVTQDPQTLALRPKAGWAIREAPAGGQLLDRLKREYKTFPGAKLDFETSERPEYWMPADVAEFYYRTNGAEFAGKGDAQPCRILPVNEMEPLDWGEVVRKSVRRGPGDRHWLRLARLADGRWLAIGFNVTVWKLPEGALREHYEGKGRVIPIFLGSDATQGKPGENPIVALTFTELLQRLIADGGFADRPMGYGDAEMFSNRG